MQIICTSLQTDNHTSTSPLFLHVRCPSCHLTNSVKAWRHINVVCKLARSYYIKNVILLILFHVIFRISCKMGTVRWVWCIEKCSFFGSSSFIWAAVIFAFTECVVDCSIGWLAGWVGGTWTAGVGRKTSRRWTCSRAAFCAIWCALRAKQRYLWLWQNQFLTRSTGTVHTSARAYLTSAAIWRITTSSRFMLLTTFHISY